jgi:transcriptional regulator NrdR family protein
MMSNRCPHCRSIDFRTVGARNLLEQSVLWILRPCRCLLCGRHFFIFRYFVRVESESR